MGAVAKCQCLITRLPVQTPIWYDRLSSIMCFSKRFGCWRSPAKTSGWWRSPAKTSGCHRCKSRDKWVEAEQGSLKSAHIVTTGESAGQDLVLTNWCTRFSLLQFEFFYLEYVDSFLSTLLRHMRNWKNSLKYADCQRKVKVAEIVDHFTQQHMMRIRRAHIVKGSS